MKFIIGLGNPGKEHERNRHNAGFLFLDYFVREKINTYLEFKLEKKFDSEIFEITNGNKVLFIKPQTYMNASGEAIKKLIDFYKISLNDIIVIHDDLDLELGNFKIQKGKGPKIHNGIISLESHLGTVDFMRVRIGVDNRKPENRSHGKDYVLQNFTDEENVTLDNVFGEIVKNWSF